MNNKERQLEKLESIERETRILRALIEEPEKEEIDLSFLIGSGIDCEFTNMRANSGFLKNVAPLGFTSYDDASGYTYRMTSGSKWIRCRPRFNCWLSAYDIGGEVLRELERCFVVHWSKTKESFKITGVAEGFEKL